jgi:hypothetical protein
MSAFALPLPNGKLQYVDIDGNPLVGGTVAFYAPGGLTPKDTWQDYGASVLNANPITLDARGQAIVWGQGRYRQIVKDSLGNLIWDQETAALTDRPYEAGFYCGATPSDNAILAEWPFTQAVTFETNWVGSYAVAGTGPSATTTVDIIKVSGAGATTIGTMSIATSGVVTLTSSISSPSFQPQDRLRWQLSGAANGVSGLSANFLGALDG